MRHVLCLLMLVLLATPTLIYAADLRPGDQVRFIERDQHIPAHPAPGDPRAHLRFVSGSEATVLQVNPATGRIEVRGEPLQGTENTGWITRRYLASRPDGEELVSISLDWCPPKGAPEPHPSGRLRLATWNLENLHAQDGQVTQDMPISCRDNTFTEFIEHIVVDRRVVPWGDRTSFRHITYRQADKAVWDQLSDHCTVVVELWIR